MFEQKRLPDGKRSCGNTSKGTIAAAYGAWIVGGSGSGDPAIPNGLYRKTLISCSTIRICGHRFDPSNMVVSRVYIHAMRRWIVVFVDSVINLVQVIGMLGPI